MNFRLGKQKPVIISHWNNLTEGCSKFLHPGRVFPKVTLQPNERSLNWMQERVRETFLVSVRASQSHVCAKLEIYNSVRFALFSGVSNRVFGNVASIPSLLRLNSQQETARKCYTWEELQTKTDIGKPTQGSLAFSLAPCELSRVFLFGFAQLCCAFEAVGL